MSERPDYDRMECEAEALATAILALLREEARDLPIVLSALANCTGLLLARTLPDNRAGALRALHVINTLAADVLEANLLPAAGEAMPLEFTRTAGCA